MNNTPPAWLYKRPRILNLLHSFNMSSPHSQMNAMEKACLGKHASGRHLAMEIGTYMGVTASIIAGKLANDGRLYCVDPFEKKQGKENPGYLMAVRQLKRAGKLANTEFLRGYSNDSNIIARIPAMLDFILVDGDHSYEGLVNDWQIVTNKLAPGGVVCLHDTTIPAEEPYRDFGSVKYYEEVIRHDSRFEHLETVYSMNVLVKL